MNIVILLGGKGLRFKNENYLRPKPLVNISGRPIIHLLLESLHTQPEDQIYIVYHHQLDQFAFTQTIQECGLKNLVLFPIYTDTRGAAETLLCLLQQLSPSNLNRPFLTLDGDTFYETDILSSFRQHFGTECIFYHETTEERPIFSYVQLGEPDAKTVLDIREKQKISSHACTGAYGFSRGSRLLQYARKLIDQGNEAHEEFYISMIYNLMLQDDIKIVAEKVEIFHCVGTPSQLRSYFHNYLEGGKQLPNENKKPLRICFDLDNTLVTAPCVKGNYATVKPLPDNIEICQKLKELGHIIIIYTARRMKTHNGNVGQVMKDIAEVTFQNLADFQIPFDEIYFGKPYADIYIDDKAINPLYGLAKEIGIYATVEDTPRSDTGFPVLPCRTFNKIECRDDRIFKYSTFEHLVGEVHWYTHAPPNLLRYIPKLLQFKCAPLEVCFLELERIRGPAMSHLYSNGCLTPGELQQLFHVLEEVHASSTEDGHASTDDHASSTEDGHASTNDHASSTENGHASTSTETKLDIYSNYTIKVTRRLQEHANVYAALSQSQDVYDTIMRRLQEYQDANVAQSAIIHGDPVFTNVILDLKEGVKLIDMRGRVGDTLTLIGDVFYDYAKVYQSILGYDFILLKCRPSIVYIETMTACFWQYMHERYPKVPRLRYHIETLTASLLFSLIPLHDDPNHRVAFANLTRTLLCCQSTIPPNAQFP